MRCRRSHCQGGYALIMLVVLLMGLGGGVVAGYTQQAKHSWERQRAEHNREVLRRAKQALLMFAYDYPRDNPGRGPGRLPCPDTDDDDGLANSTPNCISGGDAVIGRLPWRDPDLGLPEPLRDASGERLWYAVSQNFAYSISPFTADVINSNTAGTITLLDQAGNLVYDGEDTTAGAGIAAIIFAPGPITRRDEDGNGSYEYTQLRGTPVQRTDPRNYLDTYTDAAGAFDNAEFTNGESDSDDDGFILGPVFDADVGDIVVNDQMIVITAAELIEMAEKATLEFYRDALDEYRDNVPGDRYPWLDSWTTNDLMQFDADFNTFRGRVPSIFGDYFAGNSVDTRPIISDVRMSLEIDGMTVTETSPASGTPDIFFDTDGDLVTNFPPGSTVVRYFWDGHPSSTPTLPMDGVWELCPVVGTPDEEDCNQDTSGNFIGGSESDVWLQVRRLTVTLNSVENPFEFQNTDLMATGANYTPPNTTTHAYIFRDYNNNSGYLSVLQEFDQDFRDSFDIQSTGNLTFDGADRLTVGIIYYPELPEWAIDDEWHHSVQLAIAEDYKPDGNNADCTVNGCLVVNNLAGMNNDKVSLLVIAGEIDDLTTDDGAPGLFDDLAAQFEPENDMSNLVYDRRAGNDRVWVVE